MAIVTITGSDVSGGSPSGGGVGGASNLTTAGAVPYVASAGVLTEAPTGLFYDSANVRLGVGTGSPTTQVESYVATGNTTNLRVSNGGNTGSDYAVIDFAQATVQKAVFYTNSNNLTMNAVAGSFAIESASSFISFRNNSTERARFAATTGNLLLGTTTDAGYKLHVANTSGVLGDGLGVTGTNAGILLGGNIGLYNSGSGTLMFRTGTVANTNNGTNYGALFSNGNWTFGTAPADGNYKLDIAASGSSGTLRCWDQTATVGDTRCVIRAGQGQASNLLTVQNYAGSTVAAITNGGGFDTATAISVSESAAALRIYNAGQIKWSSTGTFAGTADTGLMRVSGGGVVEVNNGTAGTYRDLRLRALTLEPDYQMAWSTRAQLKSPADSIIQLINNAGTDFNRLQFGGTTSSFPALKRSSAILQVRLADDSANTQVQASRFISDQTTPSSSTDAGTAGAIWADVTYLYVQTAAGTIKRVTLDAF